MCARSLAIELETAKYIATVVAGVVVLAEVDRAAADVGRVEQRPRSVAEGFEAERTCCRRERILQPQVGPGPCATTREAQAGAGRQGVDIDAGQIALGRRPRAWIGVVAGDAAGNRAGLAIAEEQTFGFESVLENRRDGILCLQESRHRHRDCTLNEEQECAIHGRPSCLMAESTLARGRAASQRNGDGRSERAVERRRVDEWMDGTHRLR